MNIALCHFRVGETDGVSLEMEKWKLCLEGLGHKVFFLAGSEGTEKAYVIDELHYQHANNNKFVFNAYNQLIDYKNEQDFQNAVLNFASRIEEKLEKFVHDYKIDILVPNNIWSLGWGIPAAIAFANVSKKPGIQCVAHHHDFYWERDRYSHPTCDFVHKALEEYFPPKKPNIRHVVINEIAKEELKKRKGIDSAVVPNVFDFDGSMWGIDEYNRDLKKQIGAEDSIIVLQATRIAERKAVELAVDVVAEIIKPENIEKIREKRLYDGRSFENSRVVFILAGLPEADEKYIQMLYERAAQKNVEMVSISGLIKSGRYVENGEKYYSLWDAYVLADIITYPSILEGWGNQFLEGVFAKKPIVVYEYPVFVTDIKGKGFNIVSLGSEHERDKNGLVTIDEELVANAGRECVRLLTDGQYRDSFVERNFELGKKYYSYESLTNLLKGLFT